ncbi:unnamed protein product [Thlaspi arvense]|uniref:FBD domain-containing protein n=1 Tax=Thlaspi arvense TaxID=13288 RepID=A0AAU9SHX5_THLAR|nr:unnamed protein product [Thlaspi arvense]
MLPCKCATHITFKVGFVYLMDLLSNLPDYVRFHLFSFLTTKEAALTSVLSKKWRNLFALAPSLDLDDSVFLHPEWGKRERHGILQSFMVFVDRVLSLQGDSPIKRFSLKCGEGVDPDDVDRWIRNVLDRGVSELDLSIDSVGDGDYILPREMFVSSTLVNLRLASEYLHWWVKADETFLPMLKTLRLESEMIICGDKMEKLLPCFPVLEELAMIGIDWVVADDTVSSSTLKKMTFHTTGMRKIQNPKSVSFDTPNLRFLAYSDFSAEDYPLVRMEKLDVARIALSVTNDQTKRIRAASNGLLKDDVVLRFRNVVKLMNGIKNVHELQLHPDTMEVLSLCCESMPMFNNVKMLVITSDEDRGWQTMPVLLRNCPQLENLMIHGLVHDVTDKCGDACDCIYRKDKGRSLISCPVKMFVIRGFTGTVREMNMIEHFLDYFPCLEEVDVYMDAKYLEVPYHVLERIQEFDFSYT